MGDLGDIHARGDRVHLPHPLEADGVLRGMAVWNLTGTDMAPALARVEQPTKGFTR